MAENDPRPVENTEPEPFEELLNRFFLRQKAQEEATECVQDGVEEMGESQEKNLKPVETSDSELFEELLNRYERVLVFAGQLQEKTKNQQLLADKNLDLEEENKRLRQSVALHESYIRLLEKALGALGVGPQASDPPPVPEDVEDEEPESDAESAASH